MEQNRIEQIQFSFSAFNPVIQFYSFLFWWVSNLPFIQSKIRDSSHILLQPSCFLHEHRRDARYCGLNLHVFVKCVSSSSPQTDIERFSNNFLFLIRAVNLCEKNPLWWFLDHRYPMIIRSPSCVSPSITIVCRTSSDALCLYHATPRHAAASAARHGELHNPSRASWRKVHSLMNRSVPIWGGTEKIPRDMLQLVAS